MSYDPVKHHRRSIRLKGFDYSSPGAYFVTLVAFQRECLFGEVIDGCMRLSAFGKIVQRTGPTNCAIRRGLRSGNGIISNRIIRNENELQKIRKYILDNPLQWEFNQENPLKPIQRD